jgi:hypothetical protein
MSNTRTVLTQFQSLFPRSIFENTAKEHNADKNVRRFTTWNLFTVMIYAHLTQRRGIRDICLNLESKSNVWYHLGLHSLSRNNLSNSLFKRSSEVFEKAFHITLGRLLSEKGTNYKKKFKFKNPLYAIDSTTIGLCLKLFTWASFRSTKAGVKIHTMYDVKNGIPSFLYITNANIHDQKTVKHLPIKKGDIVTLDRAYLCFKLLENINNTGAFFVTRSKVNTQYRIVKKIKSCGKGIFKDQVIKFTGINAQDYPEELRLIQYRNPEDKKVYIYITNNLDLSAKTIANIYKDRWEIELFFKWIKQNVKIKTFFGTSENAVRIQIWTAAIAYLLSEYIRFISKTTYSITEVFRIIGSNILERCSLTDLLCRHQRVRKRNSICLDFQMDFGF